eukprot:gene32685-21136_t
MGLWAALAPEVARAAEEPGITTEFRQQRIFDVLHRPTEDDGGVRRLEYDGIGGPTTRKLIILSLQLLFPAVDLARSRCPVGNGCVRALQRLYQGAYFTENAASGSAVEQQQLLRVTELVNRQLSDKDGWAAAFEQLQTVCCPAAQAQQRLHVGDMQMNLCEWQQAMNKDGNKDGKEREKYQQQDQDKDAAPGGWAC